MRIITVRQPWAWAIMNAGKDVENRTRNLAGSYRGPIAIHAALADFEQNNLASHTHADWYGGQVDTRIIFGAILGTVDLTDVHGARDTVEEQPCSRWAEDWRFHLVLANPRRLRQAIPYTGSLGLTTLPNHITQQIETALAEVPR